MRIERVVVGPLEVNCYIIFDEDTKEGIVIDPGADGRRIIRIIEAEAIKLKYIVNTHGHVDHIGANRDLKDAFPEAKLAISPFDLPLLESAMDSFIAVMVGAKKSPPPDLPLYDGDIISFGSCSLKVLHTPGHTPGSVCLLGDGVVFTGDTLFAGSVGRVDLPMAEPEKLIPSIKEKLMVLPDDTVVLPGHGPESTIGYERRYNPFINGSFLLF